MSFRANLLRTRRQQIKAMLMHSKLSPQELAYRFATDIPEIMDDIRHIARSCRSAGLDIKIYPAVCKNCGYEFKDRSRIKSPSKCPKCRSEWIRQPELFIIKLSA